jgi:hypothetical protein
MKGHFLIMRAEIVPKKDKDPKILTERDYRLMYRTPLTSERYGVEFLSKAGLNLRKFSYQWHTRAKIKNNEYNKIFVRILETNVISQSTDEKNRRVVKVSPQAAENAMNQTVYLQMWYKQTGETRFLITIIPWNVYNAACSPALFTGWISYKPSLKRVPQLLGMDEYNGMKEKREMKEVKQVREIDANKGLGHL